MTDVKQLFREEGLFSKEGLVGMSEEKVEHHGNKLRPVFVRGRCGLKSKLEVEQMLGELLWESGLAVMRIKGVVCLEGFEKVLELQGVEDVFEVKETGSSVDLFKKESRILVIGE